MEEKEILEGNKLIAEFMGHKVGVTQDEYDDLNDKGIENAVYLFHEDNLPYHKEWDWLMPVIEKILDTCSETDDMESYYTVVDAIPNITSTHRTVVEFINFYNSNK